MELREYRCTRCGGELIHSNDTHWICRYCACKYDDDTATKNTQTVRELFDETKQERINNLRRNLFDAVNAEYLSSNEIQSICLELKKYLPDDFRANFYWIASGSNAKEIARYIRNINVEEYYEYIEDVVDFLIRSLQSEYLLELNDLVDRTYKFKDLSLYEKYATAISHEAEKVHSGVYETKLPREVFVAYSSKDMDKVIELVECLEVQGLKCFVAARNLRHGKGAVENYNNAIKEAIDHCRTFVFVSSMNSRSLGCDALGIELAYVRQRDMECAPSEYRNDYISMPHIYKKPRVEYRIEESRGYNVADEITNEFFDGYERVYSSKEVASRVAKHLISSQKCVEDIPKSTKQSPIKKICASCGQENDMNTKFCANCGKSEFLHSVSEIMKTPENNSNVGDKKRKKTRIGWRISFISLLVLMLIMLTTRPIMWDAVGFFLSLSLMSLIMMLSPKRSRFIFGKEKGIPKWVMILIFLLIAFSMTMINNS